MGIYYQEYKKYIEISYCDNSAELVEIPAEINGKPVTEIAGKAAFECCKNLKNIVIPNSVTNIEDSAFHSCTNLTDIIIPDSVTGIRYLVFGECESLTDLIIPNSVTSIGSSAFSSCINLENIVIPNSVTSIEGRAFRGCESLKNIVIPDSVRSIGSEAFGQCNALENAVILNPKCEIDYTAINNKYDKKCIFNGTIYGYENSTAQEFAELDDYRKTACKFDTIENAPAGILPEEKPALSGDTNGDGSISAADIVMLQQYLTKKSAVTNSTCADMNNDGKIDVFDGIILRRTVLKNK